MRWRRVLSLPLFVVAVSPAVHAQCSTGWSGVGELAGTDGVVNATAAWDPDGPGPAGQVVVAGGAFTFAGLVAASHVALHDPATGTWAPLGSGMNGNVHALAVLANGDLVAGGTFTVAGGLPCKGIARWNGAGWVPLGLGFELAANYNAMVAGLAVMQNGDLVAAGLFDQAGGVSANCIARWDGVAWSALGQGVAPTVGWVSSCTSMPNGDLVAAGTFSTISGVAANNVASWNGAVWAPLGAGTGNAVYAVASAPNGDLVAAGTFTTAGGSAASRIARWNGTSWTGLGSGMGASLGTPQVSALATLANGDIVAGGDFDTAGGVSVSNIARWNGSSWAPLGTGVGAFDNVLSVTPLANGGLIAGGTITVAGGVGVRNIASWNGVSWSALGVGFSDYVFAAAAMPNGDVVVGGAFLTAGGVSARRIARWNGVAWSPLGAGLGTGPSTVNSLVVLPNGDLVAGGRFDTAGGVTANHIARWDGTTWSPLGSGMSTSYPVLAPTVWALLAMPDGSLVAGGRFTTAGGVVVNHIARWNGTTWAPLGTGMDAQSHVNALTLRPNGHLVAGGGFVVAGGVPAVRIASWDGASWSALGSGMNNQVSWQNSDVNALATLPNGDVVAGGQFTIAGGVATGHVARWNGSTWSAMGGGAGIYAMDRVVSLLALPDGDVLAGGLFTLQGGATNAARWNGSTWSAIGGGANSAVNEWVPLPNGAVIAGGAFTMVGGVPSVFVAKLESSCPASALPFGAGCPSSGGSNTLAAATLPWLRTTFRAVATGLPGTALVVTVTSATSLAPGLVPLTGIFPQGVPGCDVLVAPELLGVLVTTTGTATSELFLPNAPALIGVPFYHQLVPIEVDPLGAFVAITATNALQVTAGVF